MARKRTPKNSDKSENQSQSTEAVGTTADAVESAGTAVLEPSAPVPTEAPAIVDEPGFVERLARQRTGIIPDPFGIAGDYLAGVRLFENRRDRLMAIKFEQKPGTEVLTRLKDSGFRWNPRDQVWVLPIHPEAARQIRIEAERTYQDVRQMVRQERGLGESPDIPF